MDNGATAPDGRLRTLRRVLTPYDGAGTYMVTAETLGRQPVLREGAVVHLLQTVIDQTQHRAPFVLLGYVFLPDHLHLVVRPAPQVTLDNILYAAMARFEREHALLMGMPVAETLWPRVYLRRGVQGVDELATVLDYLHYNPVRHGWTERPEEWPYSSYQWWVERELYRLGWGWTPPASILGKRWD